jgi:hypothetical protein
MSKQRESWPAPLKSTSSPAASALSKYEQVEIDTTNEPAAYDRVRARLERSSSAGRWSWALATSALALASLFLLLRSGPAPLSAPPPKKPLVTAPEPLPRTEAVPQIRLGAKATALSAGESALASGVAVELVADTMASARLQNGTLDIVLTSGRLDLRVSPRPLGEAVLVAADPYLFTVVGTIFSVSKADQHLELHVSEGLVAVSSSGEHVATVAAGESWQTPVPRLAHAKARHKERAPRAGRHPTLLDCEAFSGDEGPQKVACYRQVASAGGPEGERAQNALGRYLRDDMADPGAALAAFEAQRARFPHGALEVKASRAIIGLLPRLGRHAEALVETQSLLDNQPDAEDRAEIRLLRGDIYRAIFQDAISAEREYEEGAGAPGRAGDDSRFLHALCLESLGRVDEARLAYRDYLAQPGTAHAREAERRMRRLAR